MEFREKLDELEKSIERKLQDFEKDTGTRISYVNRDREKGFNVTVRL